MARYRYRRGWDADALAQEFGQTYPVGFCLGPSSDARKVRHWMAEQIGLTTRETLSPSVKRPSSFARPGEVCWIRCGRPRVKFPPDVLSQGLRLQGRQARGRFQHR